MKKSLIVRSLIGAPIGLSISYIITIVISVFINRDEFYPVVPQLAGVCGSELNAVIVQAICALIYGAVFSGATVIWETERWSLLKQTVIHCIVISFTSLPAAYLMYWMPHSIAGAAIYFTIFFCIYFIIWFSQFMVMKKKIQAINAKMSADFITK